MMRSRKAQVIIGVIASLGTSALTVFLCYWNSRAGNLGASVFNSISTPIWLAGGFAAAALLFAGIAVWLLLAELKAAAQRSQAIAEDERQYRELCDSAFDLIHVLSSDGKVLYTNIAWRKTFGYSPEEAARLQLEDLLPGEDMPKARQHIRDLIAGEPERNRFEGRFRTKSGEILLFEGTVTYRQDRAKAAVVQVILRDVTVRRREEQELRELQARLQTSLAKEQELARVDPLTHVFNRRAFYEQAEIEIARARRYSRPLCMAYVDIDNFKLVNDKLGHSTGDAVLVTLAGTLRARLRATDIIARMGGDEFAVLLPETNAACAELVLKKMQTGLLETVAENGWDITFSIGAANFAHPGSIDAMIKVADEAMYSVKARGKNDVVMVAGK